MHNLWLEGDRISKFAVCQAHRQLEEDYGIEGFFRQRPSNARRCRPTSFQLARMGFKNSLWVDIVADPKQGESHFLEQVRFIYILNVLKLKLPHDRQLRATMRRMLNRSWLQAYYPSILRIELSREANCTKLSPPPSYTDTTRLKLR